MVRSRSRVTLCLRNLLMITALLGFVPQTVRAQDDSGKVSGTVGGDTTQAYFFRGILQERDGVIFQPYGDVTVNLFESTEGLTSFDVTVGQWNSLHSGSTGAAANVKMWYESDFFAGVTLGLDNWEAGITYTSYLSPNDSFGTIKELSLGLIMDDSQLLGAFAVAPHVLLAIELDGQADLGASEGAYLELGVEPGFEAVEGVVTLGFPVNVGLSLNNYYEDGANFNDTFGFFDVGAVATVPLRMPESYGSWEASGGVKFLALGSYLEAINGGDKYQPIGFIGISIGY